MKKIFIQMLAVIIGTAVVFQFAVPAEAVASEAYLLEDIQVEVASTGSLPEPVKARMEKSVEAISSQLLTGKRIEEVSASHERYEKVIQEVFDKVLIGYTVGAVSVETGTGNEAMVKVNLLPWNDRIQRVQVKTDVEGLPPAMKNLLWQDIDGLENIFTSSLQTLPVAATDWTHGLLKKQVELFLAEKAPEFRADFNVQVAENTAVNVMLYPRLPVVRTVDLNMRSDTILNMALLTKRQKMQEAVNQLIGVPVPFVARHQQAMEAYLADILNNDAGYQKLDIHTHVTITPGERLSVMSRSDSDTYRIRLEGWGDVGNSYANEMDTSLMARIHIGRMLSSRSELFAETDFYPQAMKWNWGAGYRYTIPSGTSVGVRYDFRNDLRIDFMQPLAKKWLVRYEYRDDIHHNEYAIRYKLHDFLSLEYALDSKNSWLRFIGYF